MSKTSIPLPAQEIPLPPDVLEELSNQKPHGKLYYRWQQLKELWHALFDKYFVSRDFIKNEDPASGGDGAVTIATVEKTDYYNLNDHKFYKSPKNATVVGFFIGALTVYALRKKNTEHNHQFSLVPLPELAFVRHVTGQDDAEQPATKKHFR